MRLDLAAAALVVLAAGPAHAAPVVGFVGGFLNALGAGTWLAGGAVGAWGAGFGAAQFLTGTFLGRVVLAAGLSYLTRPDIPRPKMPKPAERMVNYAQPVVPMEYGYGRVRKGGPIGFTGFSGGWVENPGGNDKRGKRHYCILIASHSTRGPVAYYLDDQLVEVDGDGVVITHPIKWNGNVDRERDRYHSIIRPYTGQPGQAADEILQDCFTQITPSHDFAGLSYIALYASKPDEKRVQRIYMTGREWSAAPVWDMSDQVYDPRDESTDWTDNAALIIADVAARFGKAVDWDEVAEEADICDELVTNGEGGSQKRWTINAVFDDSMPWETVREAMATACDAWFYERTDGKLGFKVGRYIAPTLTLTARDFDWIKVGERQWGPDAPGEFSMRYVEPSRRYVETPSGAWVEEEGAPLAEVECFVVDSHNQASRANKRRGRIERARYTVEAGIRLLGYDAIGQRFVRITHAELGFDEVIEVQRLIREAGGWRFTISGQSVDAEDFAFIAATEEPQRPEYSPVAGEYVMPEVTGLSGVVIEDTGGAAMIEWTWDDPDEECRQDIRIRSVGLVDWQEFSVASGQLAFLSIGLVDGAVYEAQVRNRSPGNRVSDWAPVTPISVTAVANTEPPGDLVSPGASAAGSDVLAAWTAPNDGLYHATRIWRATSGTFGSASVVRTEYGAPGLADSWTDTAPGSGTWYYWLEPINASGIAGTRSGPHSVTLP